MSTPQRVQGLGISHAPPARGILGAKNSGKGLVLHMPLRVGWRCRDPDPRRPKATQFSPAGWPAHLAGTPLSLWLRVAVRNVVAAGRGLVRERGLGMPPWTMASCIGEGASCRRKSVTLMRLFPFR